MTPVNSTQAVPTSDSSQSSDLGGSHVAEMNFIAEIRLRNQMQVESYEGLFQAYEELLKEVQVLKAAATCRSSRHNCVAVYDDDDDADAPELLDWLEPGELFDEPKSLEVGTVSLGAGSLRETNAATTKDEQSRIGTPPSRAILDTAVLERSTKPFDFKPPLHLRRWISRDETFNAFGMRGPSLDDVSFARQRPLGGQSAAIQQRLLNRGNAGSTYRRGEPSEPIELVEDPVVSEAEYGQPQDGLFHDPTHCHESYRTLLGHHGPTAPPVLATTLVCLPNSTRSTTNSTTTASLARSGTGSYVQDLPGRARAGWSGHGCIRSTMETTKAHEDASANPPMSVVDNICLDMESPAACEPVTSTSHLAVRKATSWKPHWGTVNSVSVLVLRAVYPAVLAANERDQLDAPFCQQRAAAPISLSKILVVSGGYDGHISGTVVALNAVATAAYQEPRPSRCPQIQYSCAATPATEAVSCVVPWADGSIIVVGTVNGLLRVVRHRSTSNGAAQFETWRSLPGHNSPIMTCHVVPSTRAATNSPHHGPFESSDNERPEGAASRRACPMPRPLFPPYPILVSTAADGVIRIWDIRRSICLCSRRAAPLLVAAAFSQENTVLATGSAEGWLTLWRITPGSEPRRRSHRRSQRWRQELPAHFVERRQSARAADSDVPLKCMATFARNPKAAVVALLLEVVQPPSETVTYVYGEDGLVQQISYGLRRCLQMFAVPKKTSSAVVVAPPRRPAALYATVQTLVLALPGHIFWWNKLDSSCVGVIEIDTVGCSFAWTSLHASLLLVAGAPDGSLTCYQIDGSNCWPGRAVAAGTRRSVVSRSGVVI